MPNGIPTVDNAIDTGILIDRVANLELYISQTLVPALNSGQVPTGSIMPWAANGNLPTGFLLCNGASVSRTTYSDLFNVIGTAFGTASGTTFNLPDFQGRFLRGRDNSAGRDDTAASRTAQSTGGATGDNVGSVQNDFVYDHSHTTPIVYSASASATNNIILVNGQSTPIAEPGRFSTGAYNSSGNAKSNAIYSPTKVNYDGQAISFVNTGVTPKEISRTNGDTHPKNSYVNFIIKYTANVSL